MNRLQQNLERYAAKWIPERLKPHLRIAREQIVDFKSRRSFHQRLDDSPAINHNGKNIIIICIDCLRSDHTGLNDYKRNTTPFLDSFPGQYPHTIAAAPWTYSSVASILSGRYPHNHGALLQGDFRNFDSEIPQQLNDNVHLLSEILGAAGYDTLALTSIGFADIVSQGRFATREYHHNADASAMVDHLLEWWSSRDGPKFAYLHLADLHEPLNLPEKQPFGEITEVDGLRRWKFQETTQPENEFQRYRDERVRLYDTLLREIDWQLERLYNELGVSDQPLIVVTGDHGEEFWDHVELEREQFEDPRGHYGVGHGHTVFNEVVNVPLYVDHPQINEFSERWVSLVDLAPTILETLGSEIPTEMDGTSLYVDNDDSPILVEATGYGYEKKAIIDDGDKLISSKGDNLELLYDLENDYEENSVVKNEKRKASLAKYLENINEFDTSQTIDLDESSKEHLHDLGYL